MSRVTLSFVPSVRFVADVFGLLLTSRSLERSLRSRRTRAALAALVLAVLFAQMRGQAQLSDALPYAKGYLVTGDYVVGGVDLIVRTFEGIYRLARSPRLRPATIVSMETCNEDSSAFKATARVAST